MTPALLALISKGLSIAETLWQNRDLALQALQAVRNILSKNEPTPAEIAATEAELDALLEEFNADLPPDT